MDTKPTELLVPAGNLHKLRLALAYGADAVYAGAAGYSMRPNEAALSPEDFITAGRLVAAAGKKLYAAVNVMAFNHELPALRAWLEQSPEFGIHGLIVGDAGVLALAREIRPDLPLHISTQMGVANTAAARFWHGSGARRVVLARECPLRDAGEIARDSGCEVEIFVHGAMCAAVSGRCLLSAHMSRKSANRGECKHSCRWDYELVEHKRPMQPMTVFETGRETILLASRDLCLLEYLPQIVTSGITAIKIEGRMKSEYYVAAVTRVYREALDECLAVPSRFRVRPEWREELNSFTHRPYCSGFALGYDMLNSQADDNHYRAECQYVGRVMEDGKIWVKYPFAADDELEWFAPRGAVTGNSARRVTITAVRDSAGAGIPHAIPETAVFADYSGEKLPEHAILRKRLSVNPAE